MTNYGVSQVGRSAAQVDAAIAAAVGGAQFSFVETIPPGAATISFASVANIAVLILVRVDRPITVAKLRVRVQTQSGNLDLGIYSSDGTTATRLGSMGSTAVAAAGVQTCTLATPIVLSPGTDYYIALAVDNGTVTFYGGAAGASDIGIIGNRLIHFTASFPLPATLTLASAVSSNRQFWINGAPS